MQPITISGVVFEIPPKHKEGDVLSSAEAAALNQVFFSDMSAKIKPLIVKAQKASGSLEISPEVRDDINAKLSEAIKSHSYVQRSTNSYDPVQREAFKILRPIVKNALIAKGLDPKTMSEAKLEQTMLGVLEKRPDILAEAKRRIEAISSVAGDLL